MVVAAVAALVVVIALLGPITDLIARHDVGALGLPQRASHLQAARETARTQLLTLGAGLFAAGALWYSGRNFVLSREGQVTDRYTKAIEQLGSEKIDVRIGGIYALERVARDSARDHPTVIEVLSAFIREYSREMWPPAASDSEGDKRSTRADIQAAATVIGRRVVKRDIRPVDLTEATLPRVNLRSAALNDADLTGANLHGANLIDANLAGATLIRADLAEATLTSASMVYTNLTGANLIQANLTSTYLYSANLTDADLTRADLNDANLNDNTNLENARWPLHASVPEGWTLDTISGLLKRIDPNPQTTEEK